MQDEQSKASLEGRKNAAARTENGVDTEKLARCVAH